MKNLKKGNSKALIVSGIVLMTNLAMAEGIKEKASQWGATFTALQALLVIGAALVGIAMMASGGMQLKKHGENPQQVPLQKGVIFLAAGALLFGLSATSTTMLDTVFGTGSATGSTDVKTEFS